MMDFKMMATKIIVKIGIVLAFCSILAPLVVQGADRSKFKTCDQSSFCQRNRNHKPFEQRWRLDKSTIKQEGGNVLGILADPKNPAVRLSMILSLTRKGAIRMKIDQLESARRRYEAKEALSDNLSFNELTVSSMDEEKCVLLFGLLRSGEPTVQPPFRYQLILRFDPFAVEVLNPAHETVALVNSRGLMRFEEYRELNSGETKSQLTNEPREARAYDEAGRPIEDGSQSEGAAAAPAAEDQPQAEALEAESSEVQSYAETFSTFTDHRPYGPMSVGVDIHFPNSDHVYGIPEHADNFLLKDTRPNIGDPYRLYNVDIFEYETYSPMSLYGAIPFMMSHSKEVGSFGVFWLNPAETWIDIESNHSQSRSAGVVDMISSFVSSDKKMSGRLTHWFSETGMIDIWFMPGPDPATVVGFNAEALGTIPMPPMFSTGFHQSRWNYYSGEEVMQVDHNYDAVGVPLDAIWLDVEYTTGRSKKYFTWDSISFPNHVQLANNLTAKGRRLITIIDPHIKKEDGYQIYDEGNSLDVWVKDASGQNTYEGWCWPGASVWPDYLNPKVREWWASKFHPAHFPGDENCLVDIWNDMNEPSIFNGPEVTAPRDLRYFGDFENRDIHNIYGLLMTKSTYEGMAKHRPLDRPFILTRAFFAGSQRYGAAWTGDNQARWDHLKLTVPMMLSLSVANMPFVGSDIGGFFNNPDDELLIRWHQAGAFQPFFRSHAHHDAKHREAYVYRGQTLDLLRAAIRLRYSYSPYWYTLFYESHSNGMPMMRPLWFHEPSDEKTFGLEDHHLLGYSLLVKPILEQGVTMTEVYLPGAAGQTAWFDLNNHIMHLGGQKISMAVNLGTVPLFQRAGSIIPRQYRMRRSLELLAQEPVTLDIVLGENQGKTYAHGSLYVDQFKKLNVDETSSTLRDLLYYDEHLYVKSSTNADLLHGEIERILIYNWPVTKRIKSIKASPEANNFAATESIAYHLEQPRQDNTAMLEIKRPQLSPSWKVWTLKIELEV